MRCTSSYTSPGIDLKVWPQEDMHVKFADCGLGESDRFTCRILPGDDEDSRDGHINAYGYVPNWSTSAILSLRCTDMCIVCR